MDDIPMAGSTTGGYNLDEMDDEEFPPEEEIDSDSLKPLSKRLLSNKWNI
jgi:hypothetical protein